MLDALLSGPIITLIIVTIIALVIFSIFIAILFRVVVPTNEVHIIQRKSRSVPYGDGEAAGTVYYNWPSWIPIFGITRIILPVSNFKIEIDNYEAYDIKKVPFVVDVIAFFRINKPTVAAKRVEHFDTLKSQLQDILQGAIRTVLAGLEVEEIMVKRKILGQRFTSAVEDQLVSWGVTPVQETVGSGYSEAEQERKKSLEEKMKEQTGTELTQVEIEYEELVGGGKSVELLDIRDRPEEGENGVISSIQARQSSAIRRDSRKEVANNNKEAQIAEIEAKKEADMKAQEAEQFVGQKTAEKVKMVGIANEQAQQEIKEEAKLTKVKEMEVIKVEDTKRAEIQKQVQIVDSEKEQQKLQIEAEGRRMETEKIAEGDKNAELLRAQGIESVGRAEAEAKKLMELAPIEAKIKLAREIGSNPNFMEYLLTVDGIEAGQIVGVAKAEALKEGDLKIIATGHSEGQVDDGVKNLMDVFTAKGGSHMGAMLDALNNTEVGKQILEKYLNRKEEREASGKKSPDTTTTSSSPKPKNLELAKKHNGEKSKRADNM